MSDKLGVVHWRNKRTGQTGHGRPIALSAAMAWVARMNVEWPIIAHWVEDEPDDWLN